jgi:uncharacterized cofD-like protein
MEDYMKVTIVMRGTLRKVYGYDERVVEVPEGTTCAQALEAIGVFYKEEPTINEELIDEIKTADLILLSMGSLFTSIIPNLLSKDIKKAIEESEAKIVYCCNLFTQPGETDNYSVSDHIEALFKHAKLRGVQGNLFDAVLVNDFIPRNLSEKYEEANSYPVEFDINEVKNLGVEVVCHKLIHDDKQGFVRHNPDRLARAIYWWYRRKK